MHIRFNNGLSLQPTKIIGVGRNYAEHIVEMQAIPTENPVLFLKPPTALCDIHEAIAIPCDQGAVHHEIELAVCVGRRASNIPQESATECIAGFGMALDLTLRDIQAEAKRTGLPWAIAKGFDNACPISEFVQSKHVTDANNLELSLSVNGTVRQTGNTGQMLFKIPFLIAYISRYFTLNEGDLILTGTPSGVGALHEGDLIEASIDQIGSAKTKIVCQPE